MGVVVPANSGNVFRGEDLMKIALVVILFAALAHSQDPSTVSPAQSACGPKQTRFSVKSDPTAHSVVEPGAGKLLCT